MFFNLILLFVVVAVLTVIYNIYASVIKKKNKVKEAMSGIDVQLEKRYSIIPNILTIANRFMEHEKALLSEITALRTQASSIKTNEDNITEKINLDNQISSKMGQLFVNVENYPQLKSDSTMMQAMRTYSEVEEHISASRRFYNSAVNELNNAVEIFPSSVFAAMLGISKFPYFEVSTEEARKPVNAQDYLYKN